MAINSVVITIEGVIQKNVSMAPITSGINLYNGLSAVYNILLVTDARKTSIDYWLQMENLNKHGTVIYNNSILEQKTPEDRRLYQVNSLRARGFAIDFVVEPNPAVAAKLLYQGYSIMNFIHSSYALPQWRPDYVSAVKPWDEIDKEVTLATEMKLKDFRLVKGEETI